MTTADTAGFGSGVGYSANGVKVGLSPLVYASVLSTCKSLFPG